LRSSMHDVRIIDSFVSLVIAQEKTKLILSV
jgi:hypothetical protein